MFYAFGLASSYTIPCASVCSCDIFRDMIIAECDGKGLTKLPIFENYIAYSLTRIYLTNNYITHLHMDIISTWESLEMIDLRGNAIECRQIDKIPETVLVMSECSNTHSTIRQSTYTATSGMPSTIINRESTTILQTNPGKPFSFLFFHNYYSSLP